MASTAGDDGHTNGNQSPIAQPRARRPIKSQLISKVQHEGLTAPDASGVRTGTSSGMSTPIPPDAPPSVQATSSARKQNRAQQKHRPFPTIEYAARVSHFDPTSDYRDFRGFFVLFWIALSLMVISTTLRNWKELGTPLVITQWNLYTENIFELALSDGFMVFSLMFTLPIQKLAATSNGFFRWSKGGMAVQCIYELIYLIYWTSWPFLRTWTWTAQVFLTMHMLALLMKMHSYAFYNGHLSETRRRLSELDKPEGKSTLAARRYPGPLDRLSDIQEEERMENEKVEKDSLDQLREDLALELTSTSGKVTYPENLTVYNMIDFLFCPTLCYELEYPRTEGTNFLELFYKTLAVFGCIFLITLTSEEFILPVLAEAGPELKAAKELSEQFLILAETTSKLLFPFMVIFLLVFLVTFEYTLGALAEITCFADRHFYADWWNSCDWLEFSREWNIPVHHFFRRHVYTASRGHVSRPAATVITFFISALAHELIMGCITKKLRGYGFFAMMLQMPIVMVQRSKWTNQLKNVRWWALWLFEVYQDKELSLESEYEGRNLALGLSRHAHHSLGHTFITTYNDNERLNAKPTDFGLTWYFSGHDAIKNEANLYHEHIFKITWENIGNLRDWTPPLPLEKYKRIVLRIQPSGFYLMPGAYPPVNPAIQHQNLGLRQWSSRSPNTDAIMNFLAKFTSLYSLHVCIEDEGHTPTSTLFMRWFGSNAIKGPKKQLNPFKDAVDTMYTNPTLNQGLGGEMVGEGEGGEAGVGG
ncbi:hypothetical protein EG327_002767 [Venturia inaequalis]|uniref:O-acyltransferase n=1 Tax=Venturia inaequalis TaxID=5025 RepID=A0A8H3VRU1_VENIN|nr:hypothetical protein EG327_002767 [Venturia inaequalis]